MKLVYGVIMVLFLYSCSDEQRVTEEAVSAVEKQTKVVSPKPITDVLSIENPSAPKVVPYQKGVSLSSLKPMRYTVIAKSGLFLRDKPGATGAKLTKIPYFDEVEVMDTISYDLEPFTIVTYGLYELDYNSSWVKVKYKNQVGFVLSLYISPKYKRTAKVLSQEYALGSPYPSCDFNFHPNSKLYWYGVCKNGSAFERKQISLEYQYNHGEEMAPVISAVENVDGLLFCYATNSALPDGPILGTTAYNDLAFDRENFAKRIGEVGITQTPHREADGYIYTLRKNDRSQMLNSLILELESNFIYAIDWVGDLDGDQLDDYVISFGSKTGRRVLYLSSEARDEEIVRPVAIYLMSYCC